MVKCICETCELGQRLAAAIQKKDPEEMAELLKELGGRWLNAMYDRDYYESILDGSWPDSEEILTKSLKKAKQNKEDTDG